MVTEADTPLALILPYVCFAFD